jgi:hypothetical protein
VDIHNPTERGFVMLKTEMVARVESLLRTQPRPSDRQIALQTGCSRGSVARLRRRLPADPLLLPAPPERLDRCCRQCGCPLVVEVQHPTAGAATAIKIFSQREGSAEFDCEVRFCPRCRRDFSTAVAEDVYRSDWAP